MKKYLRIEQELAFAKQQNVFRKPVVIENKNGKFIDVQGKKLINFSSNDYLGILANKSLTKALKKETEKAPLSSASSRLVTGNEKSIRDAEKEFASLFGFEDAMFFSSGFLANIGLLSSLFSNETAVFYDKHIHTSAALGLQLSQAKKIGFNHVNTTHFQKRFKAYKMEENWAVIESLFSMDGKLSDISFWEQFQNVNCLTDEAHAIGVLGKNGLGLTKSFADIIVGTMGKALGFSGAFILLPAIVRRYLENRCKSYIYTTGVSPSYALSYLVRLKQIIKMEKERADLKALCTFTQHLLLEKNIAFSGKHHIIAINIGDEGKAIKMQQKLLHAGYFVFASRYPTVPQNKAILRLSLTPLIHKKDIENVSKIIKRNM